MSAAKSGPGNGARLGDPKDGTPTTFEPSRPNWRPLAIVALALLGLWALFASSFPTYSHRYRMTVEVDTPQGVRTGSSVIEVVRRDYGWVPIRPGPRHSFEVRGEAAFVDIGAGRNIIALMAHDAHAQDVDQMVSLVVEAYGHFKWDEDAWAGRKTMQGPVDLKPPLIPTLITFSDLTDPATAQVVYATQIVETRDERGNLRRDPRVVVDRFSEVLGADVRFRRAWIQTTNDPVSSGIEAKLGWLARMKAEGLGGRIDTHPGRFTINVPYLTTAVR
jgi:hypothetical protein